ncbi:MAG TPA: PH domain-containing protein [Thermoplasmata archaeon]|nr:PH domain-containing protein [Thermoplasmata archaeon]
MAKPAPAQASPFGQPPNAAVPGSFPREYIGSGETVIYETRPSVVPYILGGLAYLVFGLIITSAGVASIGAGPGALGADGFLIFLFIVLPIIGILVGYLRWTRTSFAITDKRALVSTGIIARNLTDCAHSKVQNVSLRQGVFDRAFGYGHLIFATAGINSTRAADVIKAGGVYWMGVRDPINTRRFVHEVTEYLARQQKIMEFQDMARVLQTSGTPMTPGAPARAPAAVAAPGGRPCAKCGAPLTPGSRFCNSCGAQLA